MPIGDLFSTSTQSLVGGERVCFLLEICVYCSQVASPYETEYGPVPLAAKCITTVAFFGQL